MTAHEARSAGAINPRWLVATLKGRGVPVPTVEITKKAVEAMSPSEAMAMRERLQRIGGGTDSGDELTWLANWSAKVKQDALQSAAGAPTDRTPATVNTITITPQSKTAPRPTGSSEYPASHHVYASTAALCVEEATTGTGVELGSSVKPFQTIQIEVAPAVAGKRYDWNRKIIVQLTKRELHLFIGTLFGWIKRLEFTCHGPAKDKTLRFEDQDDHLYVHVKQGKRAMAVPVGAEELFAILAMAIGALGKNAPELDSQTLLQICKRSAQLYNRSMGLAPIP